MTTATANGTDYQIDGVVLENFVTPNWYIVGSNGPWDFLGVLQGPLQRTDSGYDQSAPLGKWTQETGAKTRSAKLRVAERRR